jgi:gamma-butyrobetaine dioxygenase
MSGPPSLDVVGLFMAHGRRRYGEGVTDLHHALQCAALARRDGADDDLVLAALVHDIGRLLAVAAAADGQPRRESPDDHHAAWGAAALRPFVPARTLAAVERHVAAKRYLCAVDPAYVAALSPASVRSLAAQGGPLSVEERARFDAKPWAAEAVRLRRWDEAAKDPAAVCAPLDEYRALLVRHLGPQSEGSAPAR